MPHLAQSGGCRVCAGVEDSGSCLLLFLPTQKLWHCKAGDRGGVGVGAVSKETTTALSAYGNQPE